jgi:hypothetical protein
MTGQGGGARSPGAVLTRRRAAKAAALVTAAGVIAFCGAGCGGSVKGTAPIPPSELRAEFAQVKIGAPGNEVQELLGMPIGRTSEGGIEEWNYGAWQIVLNNGRVERKVSVRRPGPVSSREGRVSATDVLALPLGITVHAAERHLGKPEASYVTWEGQDEKVTVLRYGEWQLTFVDAHLTQRNR